MNGKGLKFEKIGQLFQVWMQFNPKKKKLSEIAILDKIHVISSF